MAAVMPATPTTPMTVPLPNYQVSGAGGVAAAAPRHGASSGSSGSVGAFFGVLAAVLVLTVLSCVFGRVCAAQAQGPDESYDCTRLARWRRTAAPAPPGGASRGDKAAGCAATAAAGAVTRDRALSGSSSLILCLLCCP